MKTFMKIKVPLWALCLILISLLAVGVFGYTTGKFGGIFGSKTQVTITEVVKTLKQEEQVSLLAVGVNEIITPETQSSIFGAKIPFTDKKKILQVSFTAKLGIDGKKVKIEKVSEGKIKVVLPKFIVIGSSDPTFTELIEKGSVLSFATPSTKNEEYYNKALSDEGMEKYIKEYDDLLKESAKKFYQSIILSTNKDLKIDFEFAE